MYQTHYGLHESPFRLNADTKFVYWSQTHQSAYRHLLYSVQSHKSLIVLAGAVGTGKTTLLHVLLEWVKTTEPTTRIAYVVHSTLSVTELFRYICHELGLEVAAQSKVDYVLALQHFAKQCTGLGKRLLLILDEAQNYSHDVLEELRLLSNIETLEDKLLQIILAGQPQLLNNINQQDLYQLKQRVNVTYNLQPLNSEETHAYIQKRLDVAGAQGRALFHADAIDVIHEYSQGLPRVINVMCDHALLYGFAANKKRVSEPIIQEVAADMGLRQEHQPRRAGTDAPGYSDETTADPHPQADQIVIGHTKPPAGKDGVGTAPFYGTFARHADWGDAWEEDDKRHRRKSLLQVAGIIVFLILILAGMSSIQWPFSKKNVSAVNSSLRSEQREDFEKTQQRAQDMPVKTVVLPESRQSKNATTDGNAPKELSKVTEGNTGAQSDKNSRNDNARYAIVKSGDTFMNILVKSYGKYDESLVSLVKNANPDISDVNTIFVGQLIRLPNP